MDDNTPSVAHKGSVVVLLQNGERLTYEAVDTGSAQVADAWFTFKSRQRSISLNREHVMVIEVSDTPADETSDEAIATILQVTLANEGYRADIFVAGKAVIGGTVVTGGTTAPAPRMRSRLEQFAIDHGVDTSTIVVSRS